MSISHEEILDLLNADPISFDSKLRVLNERFSQPTIPQPAEADIKQPQQASEQAPPADEAEAKLREREALREAQPSFDEQDNLTFEGRIRDYALQQKEVPPAEGIVTSISRGLGRGINTITKDLPGTAYEMTTGKESEYFRQARIDETVSYKAPEGGFIENLTSGNLSGLADNVSYTLANSLPSMAVGLGARAGLLALGPYGLAANIAMGVSFFATASLPEVYTQGREQAGLAPGEGTATTLAIAAVHAAAESVGTTMLLKTLGSSAYSRAAMTPGAYARTLKRYGGSAAFVGAAESIEEAAQGGLELLRNNLAGKEYTAGEVGYHLAESALGGFLVGNIMGLGTAAYNQLRTGTKERSTEELADAHARAAGNQAKPDSDVDNVVRQWAQQAEAAGIINDETTLQERIGLHVLGSGIATERGLDAEAARSYVPTAYEADVIDYFASNQAELVPEVVSLLGKTGDVRFGEITGLNDPQQAVLLTALGAGHSIEANQTSLLPDWVSKLLVPRDSGLGKSGYVLPKQYRQLGTSLPLVQARQNAALFEGIKFRELPNFSIDPSKPNATNIAEEHARNDPLSFVVLDGFSVNKTGLPVAKFTSITAEEAVKQGLTTQKELDDYRTNKGLKLLTDMQEKLASELLNRATNAVNAQTQPANAAQTQPANAAQTQPANAAQTQPANAAQTQPANAAQTQPANAAQTQPANAAQTQPANAAQTQAQPQPQLVNYTGQASNVFVDVGNTPIETSNALFDKLKQLVPNRDEAEQQAKAVAELLNDPQLAATLDSDLADKLVGALNGNGHKTAANQISRVLEAARAAKAELASIPGRQVKAELVKWGASQLHRNTSFINTTEADTAQLTTAANKVAGLMSKMRATDEDVIKLSEDADVQVLLENLPELKRINPLGTMGWLKRYEAKLTKLNEAVKREAAKKAAKDAGQAEKIAEAESQRQKAEADAVAQAADLLKQANERAAQNRQNSTERELSKLNKEQKRQLAERTRAEKKAINDEIALERDKLKTAKEKKNTAIDAEKADAASKREAAQKEIEGLQSELEGIKAAKTSTAKTKQLAEAIKSKEAQAQKRRASSKDLTEQQKANEDAIKKKKEELSAATESSEKLTDSIKTDLAPLNAEKRVLAAQGKALKEARAKLETALKEAEVAQKTSKKKVASAKLKEAKDRLASNTNEIELLEQAVSRNKAAIDAKNAELVAAKNPVGKIKQELVELNKQKTALKAEADKQTTNATLLKSLETSINTLVAELEAETAKAEKAVAATTQNKQQREQLLKKIQDKQEALEGIIASSELTDAVTEAKLAVDEIESKIATLEEAIATAQVRAAEQLKAERESAPVQQAEQITTRFSFPPTLMLVAESTKPLSDTENKLIAALITANNAQHRNRLGIVYKALSSDEKTHLASKEFDELIRDIKIVTANNIADKVVYTRFKRIYNTLRAYNVMDELGVPNIANNITNVAQFSLGVQGSEAYALVATDKNNNVVNHIIFNNQNKHVSLPQRDVSDIKVLRDTGGKLSLQEDKLVYSIGNKGLVLDTSKPFKSQIKAAIAAATEEAAIPTAEVVANTEEVTTPTAEVVADIEEEIALMDEDEWVTLTDEVLAADEKNIAELSVTKEQLEQNVAEAQAAYDRAVTHEAKLIATSQTDKAPEAPALASQTDKAPEALALAAQTDKAPEALALAAQTEPQNLIVQLQNEEMPVQERLQAAYARRSDLNNQIAYNTEVLRESGISLQDGVLSVDTSEFEFEDYGLARPKLTRANETTEEAQAEQAGFLANAPDEVKKAISSRVNEALAAISTAMAEVAEIDKTIASNEALHDQVLREVDEAKFRLELAQNELGNAEFVINRNIKQKTKYTYRLKLLRTRIAQRSSSQEPKASTLLSGRGELTYQQRFQQVYGSLEQSPELVEQGPNNVTLGVFKKHFGELLRAIDNADVSALKHMLGKTKQTDTNIANDAVTIKQHIVKTMLAYESVATTLNESEKSALAEHAIRLVWNPLLNRYDSLTSDTAMRDSAIHHQRLLSAYQQLISPRGTLLKRISKWAAGNNALTDAAAITLRLGMAIEQNQFGEVFAQLDNNIRSAYVTFLHALSWKYPSLLNTRQGPLEKQVSRNQKRAIESEGLAAQLTLQETEFDVADIANLWQQARRSPTALVDSIASDYINPELQKIFGANLLEIKDKKGINRVSVTSQAALNEASAELEAAVAAMQKQLGELEASATPLISSEELEATRTAKDTAHQAISNKQWSTNYEALLSIYLLDEASVTEDQLSEAAESLTGLRREEIPVTMTNAENVAASLVSMLANATSQENKSVSPAHKLLLKGLLNAQVAYVNAHTPQPSVDYDKVQTLKANIELLQESLAEARGEQQWSQALTEDSGYIRFEATLVSPRNIAAVAAHELLHKVLFTVNNIGKGKVVISAEPLLKSIISAEAYQNYESSKNEISRVIIENKPALGEAQHASILEEEVVAHWISLNAPMLSLPDTDSKLAANWAGRGLGLAPDVNKSLLGARQLDSSTLSEITTLLQTKIEAAKPQATAIAEWLTKLDTLTEDTSIRDHMRLLQDEAHAQQYKVITSELPKGAIEHARQAKSRQAVIAAQALITMAAKIKQQEYADLVEAAKEAVANNEEQSARKIGQQLRTIEAVLKEYQKQLDLTNETRIGSLAVTITPNKFISGISGLFSQKHKATIGIDLLGRLLLIDHLQTHGGTYKSPTTWLGFTGRESELGILHMMMQDTVMKQLGLKARDTVTTEQPPLPPIASLTTYTRTVAPFAPAVFEGKTNVNGNIYLLEQPAALRIMLEELEAAQTPTTKFSKNVLPKNSGMTLAQAKSVIMRYFPQGERILNNVNLIEPGTNLTDVLIEKTNARITLADLKQITDSQGNIEGLFEPNSGQIFVLLSNVTEATLPGVILHEGSHKLGKEVILARKLLNKEYGAATSLENIEQAARDIQNAAPESTLLPNTLRGKINYSLYKVVSIAQRAIGKMAATLGWDIKQAPLLKSHVLWFIADALTMKQSKISNASSTLFSTVQTPNEALYDWLLLHPEELTRAELMDALSKPANADLFIKGLIARYKTATGFKGSTIAMASTEQVMDTLLRMRTKQEQNESKLATSIGERLRRSMSILPGSIAGNVRRFINHRTSSMWFRVRNNVGASNAWSLIKAQRQTANYLTTHLLSKANTAFTEKLSARSIMALSAKDNSVSDQNALNKDIASAIGYLPIALEEAHEQGPQVTTEQAFRSYAAMLEGIGIKHTAISAQLANAMSTYDLQQVKQIRTFFNSALAIETAAIIQHRLRKVWHRLKQSKLTRYTTINVAQGIDVMLEPVKLIRQLRNSSLYSHYTLFQQGPAGLTKADIENRVIAETMKMIEAHIKAQVVVAAQGMTQQEVTSLFSSMGYKAAVSPESLKRKARAIVDSADMMELLNNRLIEHGKLISSGYIPNYRYGRYRVYVNRTSDNGNIPMAEFAYDTAHEQALAVDRLNTMFKGLNLKDDDQMVVTTGLENKNKLAYNVLTEQMKEVIELNKDSSIDIQNSLADFANGLSRQQTFNFNDSYNDVTGISDDLSRITVSTAISVAQRTAAMLLSNKVNRALNDTREWAQTTETDPNITAQLKQDLEFTARDMGVRVQGLANARMWMSVMMLGGSVAQGMVQYATLPTVTLPRLAQDLNSTTRATALLVDALNQFRVGKKTNNLTPIETRLLAIGDQTGLISASNMADLYYIGNTGQGLVHKTGNLMMLPFAAAETHVRKAAFLAALRTWGLMTPEAKAAYSRYNTASQKNALLELYKLTQPDSDGANVVLTNEQENQILYAINTLANSSGDFTRENRPTWAQGDVGATVFMFHAVIMVMLDHLRANFNKPAFYGTLIALTIIAGTDGWPGAENFGDIMNILIGIGNSFGLGLEPYVQGAIGAALTKDIEATLEGTGFDDAPDILRHGLVNYLLGFDFAQKTGFGRIIPGTGLFNEGYSSERLDTELLGVSATFLNSSVKTIQALSQGDLDEALRRMPLSGLRQFYKASTSLADNADYRDPEGQLLGKLTRRELFGMFLGFEPAYVSYDRTRTIEELRRARYTSRIKSEIAKDLAFGSASERAKAISAINYWQEWGISMYPKQHTLNRYRKAHNQTLRQRALELARQ